jgi:hypothetical protein
VVAEHNQASGRSQATATEHNQEAAEHNQVTAVEHNQAAVVAGRSQVTAAAEHNRVTVVAGHSQAAESLSQGLAQERALTRRRESVSLEDLRVGVQPYIRGPTP